MVQKCLFRFFFIFRENSRVSTLSASWLLKKRPLILVTEVYRCVLLLEMCAMKHSSTWKFKTRFPELIVRKKIKFFHIEDFIVHD